MQASFTLRRFLFWSASGVIQVKWAVHIISFITDNLLRNANKVTLELGSLIICILAAIFHDYCQVDVEQLAMSLRAIIVTESL